MTRKTKPTDPYAKAGVNIAKGNELVKNLSKRALIELMIKECLEVLEGLLDFPTWNQV